ncbi:MAG TPA: hypothetical protein VGI71_09825 [Scandinavium sp.]|jgi:hypothetical protein|uniref:hypothetical protein n=1 Tax=Citrobacter portucalensis TaxID=1639133 RepID=UPI001D78FA52|nr:hypothetical protein [Escherichia coli]EKQ4525022.1 hypothetical protein [Escherichia coli]MDU7900066.1 hypothetical protein [Enterobacter hormaechei]MEA3773435.1 hypothetical protein [Enterobacter hormaechei]
MNIVYFDFLENCGINAQVGPEWDFFHSFDELIKECHLHFGDDFLLATTVIASGQFTGYRESLNG